MSFVTFGNEFRRLGNEFRHFLGNEFRPKRTKKACLAKYVIAKQIGQQIPQKTQFPCNLVAPIIREKAKFLSLNLSPFSHQIRLFLCVLGETHFPKNDETHFPNAETHFPKLQNSFPR